MTRPSVGMLVMAQAGPHRGRLGDVVEEVRLDDGKEGLRVRFVDKRDPREGSFDPRWLMVCARSGSG